VPSAVVRGVKLQTSEFFSGSLPLLQMFRGKIVQGANPWQTFPEPYPAASSLRSGRNLTTLDDRTPGKVYRAPANRA
jgi:hypothetical protein